MPENDRNLLEALRAELNFVEKGGYGRSVETPWQPTSIFRDSLVCLNYAEPEKVHPCEECLLFGFIPREDRQGVIPCHDIPLNDKGETIAMLEQRGDQGYLEETVKAWLRAAILRLEAAQAEPPPPAT